MRATDPSEGEDDIIERREKRIIGFKMLVRVVPENKQSKEKKRDD